MLQLKPTLRLEDVSARGVCQYEAANGQRRLGGMRMAIVIGPRQDLAKAGYLLGPSPGGNTAHTYSVLKMQVQQESELKDFGDVPSFTSTPSFLFSRF